MARLNKITGIALASVSLSAIATDEYIIRLTVPVNTSNWTEVSRTETVWKDVTGAEECDSWGVLDASAIVDYSQVRNCGVAQEREATIVYEDTFSGKTKTEVETQYQEISRDENRVVNVSLSGWVDEGALHSCQGWENNSDSKKDKINLNQSNKCKQKQKGTYNHASSGQHLGETHQYQDIDFTDKKSSPRSNESCNTLWDEDNSLDSGTYTLSGGSYHCKMDNGGWTRLDKSSMSSHPFSLSKFKGKGSWSGSNYLLGDSGAEDGSDGRVTMTLPFNYSQFYLSGYTVKGVNATGHSFDIGRSIKSINWTTADNVQTSTNPSGSTQGDIAIGSIDASKPSLSFSEYLGTRSTVNTTITFPNNNVFSIGRSTNKLTIRATEGGSQDEDISIWNSGYIFVK